MKPTKHPYLPAALAIGVLLLTIVAAHAQQAPSGDANVDPATAAKQAREIAKGGPSRWDNEDMDMQARLRNLQKEIGAAQHEALFACQKGPAAERPACVKEARAIYAHDMAGAKEQVMATR